METQIAEAGCPDAFNLSPITKSEVAEERIATEDFSFRPRVAGKFLYAGGNKLWVRGVTYGTFRPNGNGTDYPKPEVIERDFARIASNGLNAIRTYTVPPRELLDLAQDVGLRVMVGLPWENHVAFLDDKKTARAIERRLRSGIRSCAGHPAVLCYTIGNEIPAPIVRWHGFQRIERYLRRLCLAAKTEDPGALVTYVNYPTTEYLQLSFLDFICFNVYLETKERFEAYLARLHNLAADKPLVMAEIGLDSRRNGEQTQARILEWQVSSAFASGCAGAFVFAWTDEWHRGGYDVVDWDFGITSRDRRPKPALRAVRDAFAKSPFPKRLRWPRISVIVCTYNGNRTVRDCLEGMLRLEYPNFEVIVVNDGSTDKTEETIRKYGFRMINTKNSGLSNARNLGLRAATGEIVAYIDDDAYPDPHWLSYLAATFMNTDYVGVGGPNIAPADDGPVAGCVAAAPGGPVHVLVSDCEAEHIPGCNMAFRTDALKAIGGFDRQFRSAGDDVDVCWRLQQRGGRLGFNPAAIVWHHRRDSIRAYWKQQVGYGKAEALLERKWPEKYNAAGHLTWAGRVYGNGAKYMLGWRTGRIYHGVWGSAPFQSLYQPGADLLGALPLMPEWYLVIAALMGLSALGALWPPLFLFLPLFGLSVCAPVVQAILSAAQASFPSMPESWMGRLRMRALTACLHLLQPMARLWGRVRYDLTPWRQRGLAGLALPRTCWFSIWSENWRPASDRLELLERTLRAKGASVIRGGNFSDWDLEVRDGTFGGARLTMAVEEHGAGRQMIRLRAWPVFSLGVAVLTLAFAGLSVGAATSHAWAAFAILAFATLMFPLRLLRDCAAATAAVLKAFQRLKIKES